MTMLSLPSFGVLFASVMGNVVPPSVESRMRTLAQLIGAVFVLLTLHVIVCGVPPVKVTALFGAPLFALIAWRAARSWLG